ncbi:YqgU-like beta propeller domain-containing protein [Alkalicoccobacillus murimartini]|uniref:YqgU-like 6-bladed beta-propeller domain-containing protein n=1 Tax=Alkalicoccobacillus murimartini TaxID=171685 RepID=A0ABT9YD96_9BACI|nr:hypothetical protein [Alkalicoccobacillus murimartini]MDQ0205603.1 hypothetical protein [Alkalicoccobacillus murimartini]
MKKVCAGFVLLVFVTGCQGEMKPTSFASEPIKGEKIHFIDSEGDGQLEVIGWLDDHTLLYLLSEDDSFELHTHDIFTGDAELFYSEDRTFYSLDINKDQSLFALQTLDDQDQAELTFLDSDGEIELKSEVKADEYTIYWSPYEVAECMVIAFLPEWTQEVYHVSVDRDVINRTSIPSSYIQWNSSDSVSYLDWAIIPEIEAPLKQYQLSSNDVSDWYGTALFFANLFEDRSLLVKYEQIHANEILYEFTDGKEKLAAITIPVLNTFSEQWWITSFAFDGANDLFYYLRPHFSADYVSYKDGFELLSYNLKDDTYTHLGQMDTQDPLLISTDGQWLLTGHSKQKLVDTTDGTVFTLF